MSVSSSESSCLEKQHRKITAFDTKVATHKNVHCVLMTDDKKDYDVTD